MTRKRLVKLLMAMGYSRNEANAMARIYRVHQGLTYQQAYYYEKTVQEEHEKQALIAHAFGMLGVAATEASIALKKMAAALAVPASVLMGQT